MVAGVSKVEIMSIVVRLEKRTNAPLLDAIKRFYKATTIAAA